MKKQITVLICDNAKRIGGGIEISPTILSRDYKGWNTYGMAGVLEIDITTNSEMEELPKSIKQSAGIK